jgi:hypothetical protein
LLFSHLDADEQSYDDNMGMSDVVSNLKYYEGDISIADAKS